MTPKEQAVVDAAIAAVNHDEAFHAMQCEHMGTAREVGYAGTLEQSAREFTMRVDGLRAGAALARAVVELREERAGAALARAVVELREERAGAALARAVVELREERARSLANPAGEVARSTPKSVIAFLEQKSGQTVEAIADALGWTPREVAAELDRLVAAGEVACMRFEGYAGASTRWYTRAQVEVRPATLPDVRAARDWMREQNPQPQGVQAPPSNGERGE